MAAIHNWAKLLSKLLESYRRTQFYLFLGPKSLQRVTGQRGRQKKYLLAD